MIKYWTFLKGQTKKGFEGAAVVIADSQERAWQVLYYTVRDVHVELPRTTIDPVAPDVAEGSLEAEGWAGRGGSQVAPGMDAATVLVPGGFKSHVMAKDLG